mmetsp:Transcript_71599/g.186638  ORF Transcript_71599/g.186638 Transcript_71599/m.186638 type:complete len:517 (+) Transcript_71599:131-1681(+)
MSVLSAMFGSQIEESKNGWQLAAVLLVLLATSLAYVTDGDAGQKVATALEEMSLIMVLLLAHLMVSKYYGDDTSKKTKKKKFPCEDSSDVEPEREGAGAPAEENEEREAAVRWGPDPAGSEELQSQEVGRLTTQIRAAVRLGDVAEAESLMSEMQDMGTRPGHLRRACWAVAYGELISGFVRIGNTEKAAQWLAAFAGAAPLVRPSTACVNSVIGALAAAGARDEAEAWVARMPLIGVRVDEETFSVLIGACAREGDAERAIHWLKEMRRSNLKPGAELHKLVLQSSGDGEAGSPAAPAQAPQATPAAELSWRQQPAAPAAAEDSGKPADADPNWRAAPRACEEAKAGPTPEAAGADPNWRAAPKACEEAKSAMPCCSRAEEALNERCGKHRRAQSGYRSAWASLEGTWSGEHGETYEVWLQGTEWRCNQWNNKGITTSFAIVHDQAADTYWWGDDWECFLEEHSDRLVWCDAKDWQRHPPTVWWKKHEAEDQAAGWQPSERPTAPRWVAKPPRHW